MAVQERKLRHNLAFSAVELKFLVWYKSVNSYGTETTRARVNTERISRPSVLIILIIIIIWNFRFSLQRVWRRHFGMMWYHHVVSLQLTDVSETITAFIRAMTHFKHLWNVGKL